MLLTPVTGDVMAGVLATGNLDQAAAPFARSGSHGRSAVWTISDQRERRARWPTHMSLDRGGLAVSAAASGVAAAVNETVVRRALAATALATATGWRC